MSATVRMIEPLVSAVTPENTTQVKDELGNLFLCFLAAKLYYCIRCICLFKQITDYFIIYMTKNSIAQHIECCYSKICSIYLQIAMGKRSGEIFEVQNYKELYCLLENCCH